MKPLFTPLVFALLAGALAAQQPTDTEKRVTELERKLDALSRQLEAQQTGSAPPVAEGGAGSYGLGSAASKVYSTPAGVSIGGYGEILYQNFAGKLQDGTFAPQNNQIDSLRAVFYVGYHFNDWIVFNSEVEFEHSGFSDAHPEGESIVEFAYLDFLLRKELNVRAGQLLLPMGFINEMHEPPAVLSTARPFVEREGGIIPTTWHENGVGLHGELPGNLNYRLYLVNGLNAANFKAGGISDGRQDGNKANAERFALTGRLDWHPVLGSTLGFSFYRANSVFESPHEAPIGPTTIPTQLTDVHAEYRAQGWQFRALYARTILGQREIESLGSAVDAYAVGTKQWGGYLEAGFDLLSHSGSRQALIPFLRWERLNLQAQVARGVLADPVNDQTVHTVGVSWKPIPQVVVKTDFSQIRNGARTGRNQWDLALGYEF
jgi:hypothetical protein